MKCSNYKAILGLYGSQMKKVSFNFSGNIY